MAFDKKNVAYDLSLFEATSDVKTSKTSYRRKNNNVVNIPEENLNKVHKRKINPAKLISSIMISVIVTGAIALIIQGQVELTELNQQISNATELKADLESLNTQTRMKVESKYTPTLVESYALNELDMQKVDSYQKDYIRFSQGDKAELSGEESESVFDTISNYISELWS